DARGFLNHCLDLGRADEESPKAQRIADAREVHEAAVGERIAEVARAEVAILGERIARRLAVAEVFDHPARRRDELELALGPVLEHLAGLGVAHANAR